jgi:autotransporter-associated beta strand protein
VIPLSSLGTLPHFSNSDIVTLEFLPNSTTLPLSLLQDGKLNMLVSSNHVVDWADLQFTIGGKNMTWTGASSATWDVQTTANWNNGLASDVYFDGDFVTVGTGPTNRNVTISGTVLPGSMTVNNAAGADYTIGGGAIAGAMDLTKQGAGNLTLTEANTYSGQTIVTGGTLKVGNQAALGTATGVSDATLVSGGGTLDLNGFALGTQQERILIAGAGVGGNGALINTGADQINATRFVTLTADATIGGTGRIDVRGSTSTANPPNGSLDVAGFTLTKTGANKFAIVSTLVTDGNIVVNQGTLSIETTSKVQGNGTITLNAGTTLQFYDNVTPGNVTRNMVFNGITVDNQNRAVEVIDSNISFGGNNTFSIGTASTNTLLLTGVLSETGGPRILTKSGAGILGLAGANTFSGDTRVTGGTLRLDNSLALQNSTLDYSNLGGAVSFSSLTSATLGGLKGNQALALANASAAAVALAVGQNGSTTTYSGVLSGSGSLMKIGGGTLTFLGANTYIGDTRINAGVLQLGAANRIADSSRLVMAGGTFATTGFSETLGALAVVANSKVDLGSGASVLHFADSHAESWSGLLTIVDWDGHWGTTGGGTVDKLFVGASSTGLTATQLSEINFAGFAPGAMMLATGEVVPIAPARGDFNLDHTVDGNDVAAMLTALIDLNIYASSKGLTAGDLLAIGDLNHDDQVTNADIQPLLNALASGIQPVPEPSAPVLCGIAAIFVIASGTASVRSKMCRCPKRP